MGRWASQFPGIGFAQIPPGDQFCDDTDGDFKDRLRADGQTNRSLDSGQGIVWKSFFTKRFGDHFDLSTAPDQANIICRRTGKKSQSFLVVAMASGDDEGVSSRRNGNFREDLFKWADVNFGG